MIINVGDIVIVVGVSQKGKQRTKQFGDEWEVMNIVGSDMRTFGDISCLRTPGPFLLIVAGNWTRWISKENDEHFKIIAVQSPLFPLDN